VVGGRAVDGDGRGGVGEVGQVPAAHGAVEGGGKEES